MPNQKTDESFGVIPLRNEGNKWRVLILKQKAGHWSFPKGHKDGINESPIDTAQRELFEETGLKVKEFIYPHTLQEVYNTGKNKEIIKTVTYFIALVEGHIKPCPTEIDLVNWVDLDKILEISDLQESKHKLIKELIYQLVSLDKLGTSGEF